MANGSQSSSNALAPLPQAQAAVQSLLDVERVLPPLEIAIAEKLEEEKSKAVRTVAKELLDAKGDRSAEDKAVEKYQTTKKTVVQKLQDELTALDEIKDRIDFELQQLVKKDGSEVRAVMRAKIEQLDQNRKDADKRATRLSALLVDGDKARADELNSIAADLTRSPRLAELVGILKVAVSEEIQTMIERVNDELSFEIGELRSRIEDIAGGLASPSGSADTTQGDDTESMEKVVFTSVVNETTEAVDQSGGGTATTSTTFAQVEQVPTANASQSSHRRSRRR